MTSPDRRQVLVASGVALAATLAGSSTRAQGGASAPAPTLGAASKGPPPVPLTHILARYAATAPVDQIPAAVRRRPRARC